MACLLALPAVSLGDEPTRTDRANAAKECKSLRAAMGAENFANTYGTGRSRKRNALGKCVSRLAREEAAERRAARRKAMSDCRAEQSDPNFAATHEGKSFDEFYGSGRNRSNAFGKCVSTKARENKQAADEADQRRLNAARACRAEQRADPQQFATDYGTRSNAFGKCVAKKAEAQQDDQPQT
jgi:hypothetical protein